MKRNKQKCKETSSDKQLTSRMKYLDKAKNVKLYPRNWISSISSRKQRYKYYIKARRRNKIVDIDYVVPETNRLIT